MSTCGVAYCDCGSGNQANGGGMHRTPKLWAIRDVDFFLKEFFFVLQFASLCQASGSSILLDRRILYLEAVYVAES